MPPGTGAMTRRVLDGAVGPPLSGADVKSAARRLAGRVSCTPVLRHEELDRLAGIRLWLKAENMQRTGSFKIRGALLAVESLARAGSRGIVTQSTGNHALAVAVASQDHGLPAVVVLPEDVSRTKLSLVRRAGAEVILAGTSLADRVAVVAKQRACRGYDFLDPYENVNVVAGQATATAELIHQVGARGTALDAIVLPVGGGSLLAGACLAIGRQATRIIAAEPLAVPALSEAMAHEAPVTVRAEPTIADGLRPNRVGDLPFDVVRRHAVEVVTVPEWAIEKAMRLALLAGKVLLEPAAATALAVAVGYSGDSSSLGRDVGVVLTGGNVDAAVLRSLLNADGTSDFVASCS
jgi:threonine dehydratase